MKSSGPSPSFCSDRDDLVIHRPCQTPPTPAPANGVLQTTSSCPTDASSSVARGFAARTMTRPTSGSGPAAGSRTGELLVEIPNKVRS